MDTSPRPEGLLDEALAHHKAGRLAQAKALYQRLLAAQPRNADVLGMLGTAECQGGNLEAGVLCLGRALELSPDQPKVCLNLGAALLKLGRKAEALEGYARALALHADFAEGWFGQGNALRELGRLEEAEASYDRALDLQPDYAEAHNNRANVLKDRGQLEEALCGYDRALALRPAYAQAHFNRGNVLLKLKRIEEAMAAYDRALALRPDFGDAQWSKALLEILLGRYAEGWKRYEWRWRRSQAGPMRPFREPAWLGGEPLAGRTLLIYSEQGLGDHLQFSRYALLARDLGARVLLEAPRPLVPLLSTLEAITVVPEGEPLPPFDLQIPLMSLPLALGTTVATIPAPVPYLAAPAEGVAAWREHLGPRTRPRIGIFWSGNQALRTHRSIPLADLGPLLDLPLDFHCLQKDFCEADEACLGAYPRLDTHPGRPKDFPATAALMEAMDLVLSVDSSIAHLAGALGRPLWILLPFLPDYRWMLDRPDSPWYPTATLFRQPALGDWGSVLRDVAARLSATEFP